MTEPLVRFVRLPHAGELRLPGYQSEGAAGMDLQAAIDEPITLEPGQRLLIPSGFCVELPPGHEGQIRPRSGLALKHGITVVNAPGTIDADYRGEVKVALIHLGEHPRAIMPGDRIAQMVIAPVVRAQTLEVSELSETGRGEGGYGHTGR